MTFKKTYMDLFFAAPNDTELKVDPQYLLVIDRVLLEKKDKDNINLISEKLTSSQIHHYNKKGLCQPIFMVSCDIHPPIVCIFYIRE